MRQLGFSKEWSKLRNGLTFTTYRFPRKDKDWQIEEVVVCVLHPRSKERKELGVARIIRKEPKDLNKRFTYYGHPEQNTPDVIRPDEAYEDGFSGMHGSGDIEKMVKFFHDTYGWGRCHNERINKLTLYWLNSPFPEVK